MAGQKSGFSFGGGGGGFSFGGATGGNPSGQQGFSFGTTSGGTTATTGTQGGSFSFSGQSTGQTTGGFGFGTATPQPASTAATTQGFNFGASAGTGAGFAATSGGGSGGFNFGFGQRTTAMSAVTPTVQQTAASSGPNTAIVGALTSTQPAGGFGTAPAVQPAQKAVTFGQPAASAVATSFQPAFSFAAAASAQTQVKVAVTPTVNPPASGGFTLGQPAASTAPAIGATQPFKIGQSTATTTLNLTSATSTAATTAAPSFNLGAPATTSTGSLGFKIGATTTPASTTAAPAAPAAGFGLKIGSAATPSIATTTSGVSGFSLSVPSTSATTTTTVSSGFSFPSTTTTTASLSTATTTTASTAVAPSMNYRQLEEAINKWTLELEEQEKIFLTQATQVNAWDRLLVENGEKITQLNTDVERVKIDQQRLDHELDFILAQQRELEELLVPLEKAVEQLPPISYQQHADLERENTYQLAENVDAQLKRMVQDIKEIIEHLNTTNSSQDNTDPVYQISKILNAHMDSLHWVDQNTALLQRRVDEVAKQAEFRRQEQQRNFRLAYD